MPVSPGTRHVTLRPLVSRSSPSSLARRVHHDLPLKTNRNLLGYNSLHSVKCVKGPPTPSMPAPWKVIIVSSPAATGHAPRYTHARVERRRGGFRISYAPRARTSWHRPPVKADGKFSVEFFFFLFFSFFMLPVFHFLNTRVIYIYIYGLCAGYYIFFLFLVRFG